MVVILLLEAGAGRPWKCLVEEDWIKSSRMLRLVLANQNTSWDI